MLLLLLAGFTWCGVGGGGGQALLMLLLLAEDDLRSDDGLNPLTGYNGYYRPATRTQSRWSLLYQIPEKCQYICYNYSVC